MLKDYYILTKPGIIRGNLITTMGAFLFASKGEVEAVLLLATLLGVSMVIASACVFNNFIDKDIDKKMSRTKNRALARSSIKTQHAIAFGSAVGLGGLAILGVFVNTLTMLLGVLAFFSYVVLYGVAKRRSEHGTLVGSIPGALPIVAGYVAVINNLDKTALILFLILVLWQMPHFYSIAIFRKKEYEAAGLPMLPITRGVKNTKIQICTYIFLFFLAASSLYIFNFAGVTYQIIMSLITAFWMYKSLKGLGIRGDKNNNPWAVSLFKVSLSVLLIFSTLIAFDSYLP